MDMDHMPDYARLDKPKRPPVPEVSASRGLEYFRKIKDRPDSWLLVSESCQNFSV